MHTTNKILFTVLPRKDLTTVSFLFFSYNLTKSKFILYFKFTFMISLFIKRGCQLQSALDASAVEAHSRHHWLLLSEILLVKVKEHFYNNSLLWNYKTDGGKMALSKLRVIEIDLSGTHISVTRSLSWTDTGDWLEQTEIWRLRHNHLFKHI